MRGRRSVGFFTACLLLPLAAGLLSAGTGARAQGAGNAPAPSGGVAVPELPAFEVDVSAFAPLTLDIPALPEVAVRLDAEPELATGALAPETPRSASGAATAMIVPPDEPATQVLPSAGEPVEIAPPELPAVEASVEPPAAAPEPAPRRAEAPRIDIPPPDLPKVTVGLPPADGLAAALAARLAEGLALPRLAERERREIAAAYEARGHEPLWIGIGGWTPAGARLAGRIGRAAEDGLFARDYPLPAFEASDVASLAEADLRLSALAVLYGRDARGGRLDPRRLSKLITPKLELPSAGELLAALGAAADPGAALAAYNPPHEGYRRLKAKLAELRLDRRDAPVARIPEGPVPRIGMRDERVPLVRARLGLDPAEDPIFDRSLATAVAEFQKSAGLRANGLLSPQTVAALGTPAGARLEADIVAQMERWRWLPSDLGADHIMVNVPEFQLRLFRDGEVVHQTRVIVGKPETPTPIFSDRMDHLIVNPSWYVPPSIIKNEFLPRMAEDPDYAVKRGYEVIRRGRSVYIRQPPGERNALGHIKFMFPNEHAVYLHDTPTRGLFGTSRRSYSHGCVRVDQPFALAEQVLGRTEGWSAERVRRLVGGGERTIRLPRQLPIHLVYNTHVVDAAGELVQYDDLYGIHRQVRQALESRL